MNIRSIIRKACNSSFCGSKGKIDNLPMIAVDPTDYTILEDPKLFRERIIYLINNAKKRICISALYLQNDEAGQEILNCLYAVQKRNPRLYIRIYVDFHRAQRGLCGKGPQIGNNAWYFEMAQKQLVHPVIYGVPVKRREIFGVLHLKGFVFDDTVLYSGASINNVYLEKFDRYRIDRYHEIVSHELADSLCNYCTDVFHQNGAVQDLAQGIIPTAKELAIDIKAQRKILCCEQYNIANQILNSNQIGITPLVGLGKKKNYLNATITNLIGAAKDEIVMHTPYFNLPSTLLKQVNKALKRGVKITIIVGDKQANDFFIRNGEEFNKVGVVPYIYEINLRDFVSSHQNFINQGLLKIALWKDGDNTYHVKGMTVDRTYTLITGNNFNPRAWGLDLENGLLIHDRNHLILEKLMHEKQYLLMHTQIITRPQDLQSIDDYPEEVKKLIQRVKKFGAQWLLRKLL
jgi:CDP-diacylglycerol---serine O-phosphatidyltransferase